MHKGKKKNKRVVIEVKKWKKKKKRKTANIRCRFQLLWYARQKSRLAFSKLYFNVSLYLFSARKSLLFSCCFSSKKKIKRKKKKSDWKLPIPPQTVRIFYLKMKFFKGKLYCSSMSKCFRQL